MYSRLGDIARSGWLDNRAGGILIAIRFRIVVALFGGNVWQKVARQYVHNAVRWPLYRDHASNVVALLERKSAAGRRTVACAQRHNNEAKGEIGGASKVESVLFCTDHYTQY